MALMTAIIFQKDVIGNVCSEQEDSHDIANTPNGDVFIVCDGMGGHAGGKKASSLAVESIIDYLNKELYPDPLQALNEALQFANMQILGYASHNPELKGMGTTACILLIQGVNGYIAHVGDSRIYLYLGEEKQLHRITKDHSYVQTLVDADEITDEQAEHHPNKNRILKALGIKPELQPTFNSVLPKKDDVFLICSDGLNSMISDSTIADVLSSDDTLEQKGDMLINLALKGENGYPGGQDNITVVLIQIESSEHPKSKFTSFNPGNKSLINKTQEPDTNTRKPTLIITVLIAFLCIAGAAGAAYYFIHINSKKQQIEKLRYNIQKAEEKVNDWNNKVSEAEERVKETGEKTKEAEDTFNKITTDNPNYKDVKNTFDNRKMDESRANLNLKDCQKHQNEAIAVFNTLKNSFDKDSLNIVNPKKEKNESNNNRKRSD